MPRTSHPAVHTVAVVGAGAMGAMYASHFSRAGFRTLLLAEGERAARLRATPITVNGVVLDAEVIDPLSGDWDGTVEVGLILVAVKHHQLADAVELIRPVLSPSTSILSVLNGLDSEQILIDGLGVDADQVPLCIALAMDAEREGQEVRFTQAGRLVLGPDSPRVAAVQDALTRAGLAWDTPADMRHQMWWKFMVNVSLNQPSAVLRAPYGSFHHDGPARELMAALIDEVIAVANAEGVALGQDDIDRWHTVLAGQPAAGMTSMHQDVLAGRPTEVGIFGGRVVELGRKHGIPVPHNQTMVWILTAG